MVHHEGDEAVLQYTREFDTRRAPTRGRCWSRRRSSTRRSRACPWRWSRGCRWRSPTSPQVSQAGVGEDVATQLPQGQRVTVRELPVSAAAVYVPGGRAPYPSTAVMGVVTARAAGVLDVVVCSPPGRDGQIDPLILGTCRLLGVERVYRMGGAQAIAALAYGTETVARVDVVVGPGNMYVQEAKRQLSQTWWASTPSRAPATCWWCSARTPTPPGCTRPARPGRARRRASFVAAISPSPRRARRARGRGGAAGGTSPGGGIASPRAGACWCRAPMRARQ